MNATVQKVQSVVMFLIILGMIYIAFIREEEIKQEHDQGQQRAQKQEEETTSAVKKHDDFKLKLIGHGKHLQAMQDTLKVRYERYNDKMEFIDDEFERIGLRIEQLEDIIMQKLDRISDDIEGLRDEFGSFKRSQNRTIKQVKMDVRTLKDDIELLDRQLNPKKYEETKE